jgi:uncharacterized protein YyaL (SSP411 family)
MNGVDFLAGASQIVLVGKPVEVAPLRRVVRDAGLTSVVLQVVAPGAALPPLHPAHGKTQQDGRATAYLCRDRSCSLPITEPQALAAALAQT